MILPRSELKALTGYVRASAQGRWLRRHGWKFVVNGRGHVIVALAEYNRMRSKYDLPSILPEGYRPPTALLSIDELRALPRRITYRAGGVYFLWRDDELLYIGRTFLFGQRIGMHEFKAQIPFDSCSVIVCAEPLSREDLEQAYIRAFTPPYNRKIS